MASTTEALLTACEAYMATWTTGWDLTAFQREEERVGAVEVLQAAAADALPRPVARDLLDAINDNQDRGRHDHTAAVTAALALLRADAYRPTSADETVWCPPCARRRVVIERSDEGHMEPRGEVGYRVTHLMCGHDQQGAEHIVAPAPGGESLTEAVTQARTQARVNAAAEAGWA